ncbi:hypothetical protein LOC68_23205 [Blastopirellula sp. JC732]|uniref:Uncharacterized protein n=1 Tax=Blastopirellula sediminis TaxID=2894196 RepID=A0A9X1MSK3_9BACT|nr:hypothetical protein [Blastopirellula sediminis]MCC9605388.1 hypothetical protein [Blastopirellula sediminis]MCC9631312.1 hypothetical protein [Blastopirellula sediminis]
MEPPTTKEESPANESPRLQRAPGSKKLMAIIIGALAVWGVFLAVGVFLNFSGEAADRFDLRRPVLVLGCTLGFLGIWLLLLWAKRRTAE